MVMQGWEPACTIGADPDPLLGDNNNPSDSNSGEDAPDPEYNDWLSEMEEVAVVMNPEANSATVCTELYDSGTTQHISLYKADFTPYLPLNPPALLNMAN